MRVGSKPSVPPCPASSCDVAPLINISLRQRASAYGVFVPALASYFSVRCTRDESELPWRATTNLCQRRPSGGLCRAAFPSGDLRRRKNSRRHPVVWLIRWNRLLIGATRTTRVCGRHRPPITPTFALRRRSDFAAWSATERVRRSASLGNSSLILLDSAVARVAGYYAIGWTADSLVIVVDDWLSGLPIGQYSRVSGERDNIDYW